MIVYQLNKYHFLFFLEVRHNEFMRVSFTEIFKDQSWINLALGMQGVNNVVFEHQIFEKLEVSYFLLLTELIDQALIFCKHVVKDYLFSKHINYFIIVDGLGTVQIQILIIAESFLKR